jgi:hypothetical protein
MSGFFLIAAVLGAYTLIVLAIGAVARMRAREDTEEDYFVAGRTFNLFVLFFTYEASLFSMWFFLGSGGFWLTQGIWFYCHALWLVMSGLLLWWLGVRIWLCGKKWNFVTPADLLAHRYGSEAYRVIVALITMGFIFPYILMQIKGGGLALAFTTQAVGQEIPFWQGAGLMALLVLIYTTVGGARAVAWTDAVQGLLFLSIIWIIGVGAVMKLGGGVQSTFDTLVRESREHLTLPSPVSKWGYSHWLSWWFVQGIALGNAGVWMRIYSAKSPTTLRHTGALIPLAGILAYDDAADDRRLLCRRDVHGRCAASRCQRHLHVGHLQALHLASRPAAAFGVGGSAIRARVHAGGLHRLPDGEGHDAGGAGGAVLCGDSEPGGATDRSLLLEASHRDGGYRRNGGRRCAPSVPEPDHQPDVQD